MSTHHPKTRSRNRRVPPQARLFLRGLVLLLAPVWKHRRRWGVLLGVVLLGLGIAPPVGAQVAPGTVGVYYIGPEDQIAVSINESSPYLVRVEQPELAQVLVINNVPLTEETASYFGSRVREGEVGLVLFCGPLFPERAEALRPLLGVSSFGLSVMQRTADVQVSEEADPLQDAIAWAGAPDVRDRTQISNPNLLKPVVATEAGTNLLSRLRGRDATQVLIVGPWLEADANRAWIQWPYFRYMVYRLIADAADIARPLSFADYPLSPVPRARLRWAIAGIGGVLMLGAIAAIYTARRRLFLQPELSDTSVQPQDRTPEGWKHAGYPRVLAGLLTLFPLGAFLLLPLALFYLRIVPEDLLPSVSTLMNWQRVGQWMAAASVLFDAGIGVAAVYYFSIYQIHYPKRAIRFFQFYIWWQVLSGALQVGLTALGVATVFHQTPAAHLTYHVLAWAILQFPGFYGVFALFFRAAQRFDREQILRLLVILASVGFQVVGVNVLSRWGNTNPAVGTALGGAIGLGVGLYLARFVTFFAGVCMFRREGYNLQTLLQPDYDGAITRQALSFGLHRVPGDLAFVLGTLFTALWVMDRWTDQGTVYTQWMILIHGLSAFDMLIWRASRGVMPAMAQASKLNYRTLLRYTVSQTLRYGMVLGLFLVAALGAMGPELWTEVLALPTSTATWLMPVLGLGVARWWAWVPHRGMESAGRPGLSSWVMVAGQILRVGGLILVGPRWGLVGVLGVIAVALIGEILLAWLVMQRAVARVRINVWQTWIAPSISAFLLYQGLRVLAGGGMGGASTSLWARVTGYAVLMGLSVPVFMALTALFGGWDPGSLDDLGRAVELCGLSYPFAWLILQLTRLGARLSPLHGRFPVAIHTLAREEADALTHVRSASE